MNRQKYAIRNIFTMLSTYIVTTIISFVVRAIFVRQLGSQYLGLNGVFTSILSVLAISDLGMESVFAFLLYKPLAQNDNNSIRNFIALFRKVYTFVGGFIFITGSSIIPFLPLIIGEQGNELSNVTLIYFILLVNSASSYLFTYNRTILNANQKNYIITGVNFLLVTGVNLLQIVFLYLFDSMVIYVSLFLISTLITNIILSRIVLKGYPFLHSLPKHPKLSNEDKKTLLHNTVGGLSNKLGSIIVFASDNILLSIFVNLTTVGLYSNYTMILNSLSGLIQKVFGTLTAGVGNLSVQAPESAAKVFKQFNFYITGIAFFLAPQLLTMLRPLVVFWLGEDYVLSQYIVLLITINFVIQISRAPALVYIDAYGLQWVQKWKSVIESILNIGFSLVALSLFHLGLIGILLGTIGSTTLFVSWYEPLIVLNYSLNLKSRERFQVLCQILIDKLWLLIPTIVVWLIMHFFHGSGILFLLQLMIVNLIISIILFYIIFGRRNETKSLYYLFVKNKKS